MAPRRIRPRSGSSPGIGTPPLLPGALEVCPSGHRTARKAYTHILSVKPVFYQPITHIRCYSAIATGTPFSAERPTCVAFDREVAEQACTPSECASDPRGPPSIARQYFWAVSTSDEIIRHCRYGDEYPNGENDEPS